jgi:hypothetical protein
MKNYTWYLYSEIYGAYYSGGELAGASYIHRKMFGEGFTDLPIELGGRLKNRKYENQFKKNH